MSKDNTKDRLLDAAERLFAEKGVKETSVREITRAAEAHLSSINYHFSTKYGLIRAVIGRRIKPLNRRRLELLESFKAEAGEDPVPIEKILYALIMPGLEMYSDYPNFLLFAGRMISDPDKKLHRIFVAQLDDFFLRIKDLLQRNLTDIPEDELMWRIHFAIGAVIHTWTNHSDLEIRSKGVCKIRDKDEMVKRLVAFCAAGLRAPKSED